MDKKNNSIAKTGLTSILVIFLLLFSSLTWSQDNTQSKTENGSTVTIAGPFTALPNTNYDIVLSAFTDVSIFQFSLTENGVTIAGSGFTFGSQLNQTYTFNRPVGSYTYLFSFRGVGGAHGWPAYTTVSIIVNVATPSPLWAYKITGPDGSTTVEASTNQVVYFELDAVAPDYVWGNILALYDASKLQAVSIEEDPNNWSGFWTWWTTATGAPEYYGGGNYYYYDTFGFGSDWAQQWVAWYGDGHAGPVGTIDPNYGVTLSDYDKADLVHRLGIQVTDVDKLGAIRLYTSTYAGGNGTSPLRLGFNVLGYGTASFHTLADGSPDNPIRYDWNWHNLDSYLQSNVQVLPLAQPPAAPSNLVATAISHNQINLTWQDNANNEDGTIIERAIYGDSNVWMFEQVATAPSNSISYLDEGLSQGVTYHYRIKAYNQVGESHYSNEADTMAFITIVAPSNLIATAVSSSQIDLSWQDNSYNEQLFKIERAIGESDSYNPVGVVGTNTTTFSDTNLEPYMYHSYRVVAYNEVDGNSHYSNEADAITLRQDTNELINLLGQYYSDGAIKPGIYQSLLRKLEAVKSAFEDGNLVSASNKLDAFNNELMAQDGKGVDDKASSDLSQKGSTLKYPSPRIRGSKETSRAPNYIPVCEPMSITANVPSGVTGEYQWTVTPPERIRIVGGATGKVESGKPISVTIHATAGSQGLEDITIELIITPTKSAKPITATHKVSAIKTDITLRTEGKISPQKKNGARDKYTPVIGTDDLGPVPSGDTFPYVPYVRNTIEIKINIDNITPTITSTFNIRRTARWSLWTFSPENRRDGDPPLREWNGDGRDDFNNQDQDHTPDADGDIFSLDSPAIPLQEPVNPGVVVAYRLHAREWTTLCNNGDRVSSIKEWISYITVRREPNGPDGQPRWGRVGLNEVRERNPGEEFPDFSFDEAVLAQDEGK